MEKIFYEIAKNNGDKIIVSLREYKGKEFVDVRIFFFDEESQAWIPTKKGVAMAKKHVPELIKALNSIQSL